MEKKSSWCGSGNLENDKTLVHFVRNVKSCLMENKAKKLQEDDKKRKVLGKKNKNKNTSRSSSTRFED